MATLFFACRWWRDVDAPNREPGDNPGLPRSGKQERRPIKALVLSGTGKPGLVEDPIQRIGRACKSEDLPAATPSRRAIARASEGRRAMIGSFPDCLIVSLFPLTGPKR